MDMKGKKTMGRVIAALRVTNLRDIFLQDEKVRTETPRTLEVEALVDTGATGLALKRSVIRSLGLKKRKPASLHRVRSARSSNEPVRVDLRASWRVGVI